MPLSYSCCGVFWPVLVRPLLGLLHALLSIGYNDLVWSLDLYSYYFGLSWPITLLVGSFGPFLFPWASSAYFLILHSHGFLLTLLGFPGTITISFGVYRLSINPLLSYFITSGLSWPILTFLHHIMPMGLLLLLLGSFRPICFPQDPLIYFIDLWSIIPAIRA